MFINIFVVISEIITLTINNTISFSPFILQEIPKAKNIRTNVQATIKKCRANKKYISNELITKLLKIDMKRTMGKNIKGSLETAIVQNTSITLTLDFDQRTPAK